MQSIVVVDYDPVWVETFQHYAREFGQSSVTLPDH
jgi:hypothetical protein